MKSDARYLQPRLLAANISMDRQNYKDANRYANEILALIGDNPSARLLRATSLTGMGNFTEAGKELSRLNREYPRAAAPRIQSGELLRAQKNYKEAENVFRGLYEADRTDILALQSLLNTYYDQGKYDAAIQYLSQESHRGNSAQIRNQPPGRRPLRGKKCDMAVPAVQSDDRRPASIRHEAHLKLETPICRRAM